MYRRKSLLLLLALMIVAPYSYAEIEIVSEFETRPGNPAVTPDNRKIVSMQPIDKPKYQVVEVLPDGAKKPFPNEKWASAVGTNGIGMQAVIGVTADTNGIVWMLDMGETDRPRSSSAGILKMILSTV